MTVTELVPRNLQVSDLQELLERDPSTKLVDVRSPAEYETSHIAGSYNVPLDRLAEHRDELVGRVTAPVVLICRSGNRAGQAEQRLAEAGMTNLHVLQGGMLSWEAMGGDVVQGKEAWELERQVRLVAGSIVLTSILASVKFPKAKWLAAGIGGGLTFAALSNTCAMGALLMKLPYNQRGAECDIDEVVAQLTRDSASRAA